MKRTPERTGEHGDASTPGAKTPAALPVFDARQPVTRQPGRDYLDSEDEALTLFVMGLWSELISRDEAPVPPCPRCESHNTRLLSRATPRRELPLFTCRDCGRMYSRLAGTPLHRLQTQKKMPAFIRLLSQPISLYEAGRRLDMDYPAVSNWLMRFRELIARHDPDECWSARVRFGIRYRPQGTCRRCGFTGPLNNGGFTPDSRRRAICPQCAHIWPIDTTSQDNLMVHVLHDPAFTAVARRRRKGLVAPDLPGIRHGVLKAPPRVAKASIVAPAVPLPQPERFDFSAPLHSQHALPRHIDEDKDLTAFLVSHIDWVLSTDLDAPDCGHCGSDNTRLAVRPRPGALLPRFLYRGCGSSFTRVTGTALERALRRDVVMRMLPWLSRQCSLRRAALALGTTSGIVEEMGSPFPRMASGARPVRRISAQGQTRPQGTVAHSGMPAL